MRTSVVILCAALFAASSCIAQAPPAQNAWKLVWSDEFNGAAGAAPNPANWNYDLGNGGWGNGELETYTNSPNNVFQDGQGNLIIRAIRDSSGNYTSARLQTGSSRSRHPNHRLKLAVWSRPGAHQAPLRPRRMARLLDAR